MAALPSLQFYPADWLGNTNRRRCSHAASGALIDVICTLHGADEYGIARYSLAELAKAIGAPLKLLRELADKGLLKGTDKGTCEPYIYTPRSGRRNGPPVVLVAATNGPIWFIGRMVKDAHVRTVRGESSRFDAPTEGPPKDAPKAAPEDAPKPPFGDGSSSSSSSSLFEETHSVSKDTGSGEPPSEHALVFGIGVPLLMESGQTEQGARNLLGMWMNRPNSNAALVREALEACAQKRPKGPVAYITACLSPKNQRGTRKASVDLEQQSICEGVADGKFKF